MKRVLCLCVKNVLVTLTLCSGRRDATRCCSNTCADNEIQMEMRDGDDVY